MKNKPKTVLFFIVAVSLFGNSLLSQNFYLFIGTYTGPEGGKGIHVYNFNSTNGELEFVSNTEGIINPSYLTVAPNGKFIYSCTESKMHGKGSVSAFAFDRKTGKLKFINKQASGGENPVYLSVHKNNKWLVNGNYTGGSVSVFPIKPDGSLLPYSPL